MERIVDLVCSNKLMELKEATHLRLVAKAKTLYESAKKKVAHKYHSKKHEVSRVNAAPPKYSADFKQGQVGNKALMFRTAKRYGYLHESTSPEIGGKKDILLHPNGFSLRIHSGGRDKSFWSHSKSEGNSYLHLGSGDNPTELLQHLEAIHGSFDHKSFLKKKAQALKESNQEAFASSLQSLNESGIGIRSSYRTTQPLQKHGQGSDLLAGSNSHPQVHFLHSQGYKFHSMVAHRPEDGNGGISHRYTNDKGDTKHVGPFHKSNYINTKNLYTSHEDHPMHNTLTGYGYKYAETRSAGKGQYEHSYTSSHPSLPHVSLVTHHANHTFNAPGQSDHTLHNYIHGKMGHFSDTDHAIIAKSLKGEHVPVSHKKAQAAPVNDAPKHVTDITRTSPTVQNFKFNHPKPITPPLKKVV